MVPNEVLTKLSASPELKQAKIAFAQDSKHRAKLRAQRLAAKKIQKATSLADKKNQVANKIASLKEQKLS